MLLAHEKLVLQPARETVRERGYDLPVGTAFVFVGSTSDLYLCGQALHFSMQT
jgi:hypothetical protein